MLFIIAFAFCVVATVAKPTDQHYNHIGHNTLGNYEYKYVLDRISQSDKHTKKNPLADYTYVDPEDSLTKSMVFVRKNHQRFVDGASKNYVVVLEEDEPVMKRVAHRVPINANRFLLGGILQDTPEVIAARKMHLEAYLAVAKSLGH